MGRQDSTKERPYNQQNAGTNFHSKLQVAPRPHEVMFAIATIMLRISGRRTFRRFLFHIVAIREEDPPPVIVLNEPH